MNMTDMAGYLRDLKRIDPSKRVRWDIDRDVVRGRTFDFTKKFLPDSLSLVGLLPFLNPVDRCFLSQIQGRTYANLFERVECFISARFPEVSRAPGLGDQSALEAPAGLADEDRRHPALFRRIETLAVSGMPAGYRFAHHPDAVTQDVAGRSAWSVLALTCHIGHFIQLHYRESIDPDPELSDLWKDVFLFHWKETSQHTLPDELEWAREHERLTPVQRDLAVDDLIALLGAVDGILQAQAVADVRYFLRHCAGIFDSVHANDLNRMLLKAYRWQYILCGVQATRFGALLRDKVTPAQGERIRAALISVQI